MCLKNGLMKTGEKRATLRVIIKRMHRKGNQKEEEYNRKRKIVGKSNEPSAFL